MRLGFFGGSFDPPHRGHLAVATRALHGFALDRVLLAPTAEQPLKPGGASAQFPDRLAMVHLLCQGIDGLEASEMDGPRSDGLPNYTVDALERLRAECSEQGELFAIVGADAFLQFSEWKGRRRLLQLAEWIVLGRPGINPVTLCDQAGLTGDERQRVVIFPDLAHPASATDIRARLRAGEDCSELVPERVLSYIHAHHLYGT